MLAINLLPFLPWIGSRVGYDDHPAGHAAGHIGGAKAQGWSHLGEEVEMKQNNADTERDLTEGTWA
jgi:hypothetical protein